MRKIMLICAFFFYMVSAPQALYATYIGTNVGVYKFEATVIKAQMYNSTTGNWVTLWDYSSNPSASPKVDLGAGSVGAQMGTYASGVTVPIGTYTQMRVTTYSLVKIRGWAKSGTTYYYTDDTVAGYQTSSKASVPTDSDCKEITISPPEGSGIPSTTEDTTAITGGGLVVEDGQSTALSIIFPMEQVLTVQNINGIHMVLPGEAQPTISPQ